MKMNYYTLKKVALIAAGAVILTYSMFRKDLPSKITTNNTLTESVDSMPEPKDTITKTLLEQSLPNHTDTLTLNPDSLSKLVNAAYNKTNNIDDSTIKSYIK